MKEKGCPRAAELQCCAAWGPWQYIAGKGPEPPPVSQPGIVRLAQTLEVETPGAWPEFRFPASE